MVGIVIGLVVFWPRMSVEASSQIDAAAPTGITMTITNTGWMPLRNLQPILGVGVIAIGTGPPVKDFDFNGPMQSKIAYTRWFTKTLAIDEKYQIRLDASGPKANDGLFYFSPGSGPLGKLDFSLIIAYNPWIIPIRGEKEFRFVSRLESNGMLTLMARPVTR